MNYEGLPCKWCGEIIEVYSLSGYCRECWHARRGHPESKRMENRTVPDRIKDTLERHKNDLTHYHFINTEFACHVPEHRYVLENATGQKIPDGWVVHHLNGLNGDNRIENLVTLPRSDPDSKSLVNALKKRIRELEQLPLAK